MSKEVLFITKGFLAILTKMVSIRTITLYLLYGLLDKGLGCGKGWAWVCCRLLLVGGVWVL
jgi:hypothetical protein